MIAAFFTRNCLGPRPPTLVVDESQNGHFSFPIISDRRRLLPTPRELLV